MVDRTILLLAGRADPSVRAWADAHADRGLRLITPLDLSTPGWCLRAGRALDSVAVSDGVRVAEAELAGVITRLFTVTPADLTHIAEADRVYVSAEMTAFLLAWLAQLHCPVINRPAPPSLAGPCWRWEQWVALGHRVNVPMLPGRRVIELARRATVSDAEAGAAPPVTVAVTVVGGRELGASNPSLRVRASALARAAGMDLLGVHFDSERDDARVSAINPWPDLGDERIAAAVFDWIEQEPRRGS